MQEFEEELDDIDESKKAKKSTKKTVIPKNVQDSWDLFRKYSKNYERGNPLVRKSIIIKDVVFIF